MPISVTPASLAQPGSRAFGPYSGTAFWRLMRYVALAAAGLHAVFIALFWALDAVVLAAVNVGSVLLLSLVAQLLRQPVRRPLAAYLMLGEGVMHAALAVWLIGWDSGFQLYLMVMVPVLFMHRQLSMAAKWRYTVALVALVSLLAVLGVLVPPHHPIPDAALHGLQWLNLTLALGMLAYFSQRYFHLMTRAEAQLHAMATTDPLTGLGNRRYWSLLAQQVQALQRREGFAVSLVLGDIDHFKSVNDQHGHDAGDAVLVAVAQALAARRRASDVVGRWGGEEFVVLLPGASLEAAQAQAEGLRRQIHELRLTPTHPAAGPELQLGMTLGVAELAMDESIESALQRADAALYAGKAAGRNRVVTAPARSA